MDYGARYIARHRIEQARENLKEAKVLVESRLWGGSVNRIYYACFHAASALLLTIGQASKTHSGVRSLFNQYFIETGRIPVDLSKFYGQLFNTRQQSDYGDFFTPEEEYVREALVQAELFVNTISAMIGKE